MKIKENWKKMFHIPTILLLLTAILMGCDNTDTANEDWISTDISQEQAINLQKQVDEGHRPGLLDWYQVAREYVSQKEEFTIDDSVEEELIIDEEDKKIVQYKLMDGRLLQLELTQPATKGSTGIYVVSRYRIMENNAN